MCKCPDGYECGECFKPEPKPHKHADLIKAWADGAEIQIKQGGWWFDIKDPGWYTCEEYRIKREPMPDVVIYSELQARTELGLAIGLNRIKDMPSNNVKITFDGETGKLKSVEIIK